MTTPTLIEMIQAARDVEQKAIEISDKAFPGESSEMYRYRRDFVSHTVLGSDLQHSRLAPALICAVEALEHISADLARCEGCSEPSISLSEHYDFLAQEALTRIREMLEGKEPKV